MVIDQDVLYQIKESSKRVSGILQCETGLGPGIYFVFDENDSVCYIGKTSQTIRKRLKGHIQTARNSITAISLLGEAIEDDVGLFRVGVLSPEQEISIFKNVKMHKWYYYYLERKLILALSPRFNIDGIPCRDRKSRDLAIERYSKKQQKKYFSHLLQEDIL